MRGHRRHCTWALSVVLIVASCASPVDLARKQRGNSPCARAAEKTCAKSLEAADQQACIKRETYLCELSQEEGLDRSP